MNEIIGPIYYVFATDSNSEWKGIYLILFLIFALVTSCMHHYKTIVSVNGFTSKSLQNWEYIQEASTVYIVVRRTSPSAPQEESSFKISAH